jgi:hypothetical protein
MTPPTAGRRHTALTLLAESIPLLKKLFAPHLGFLKTYRYQYMMTTTSQSGNEKSSIVDPDPVDP